MSCTCFLLEVGATPTPLDSEDAECLCVWLYRQGDEIISNKQQGYLLRTKQLGTDEGGVATGYSVLDSPYLVDSWPVEEHTSPVGL